MPSSIQNTQPLKKITTMDSFNCIVFVHSAKAHINFRKRLLCAKQEF